MSRCMGEDKEGGGSGTEDCIGGEGDEFIFGAFACGKAAGRIARCGEQKRDYYGEAASG